ncbi:MAG: hypothetical protein QME52_06580 [Bacteroidota bacterium]|nr:hypothetical protein [Bacteroidota bacterium]
MTNKPLTGIEWNRFRMLMTAALDGELSNGDKREFQQFLSLYPECQNEWNEYQKLKEMTMQIKFNQPPEEMWDRYWVNIYNRIERGIGWIFISIGAIIVLFYGGFKAVESIIADTTLEWFMKAGILALLAGLVIVLVSVIREKFFTRKSDKYKEIQR